jgi:pectinesterase
MMRTFFSLLLLTTLVISDVTYNIFDDGSGDYKTIQEALNNTSGRPSLGHITFVLKGIFQERVLLQNFSNGVDFIPSSNSSTRPLIIYNISGAGGNDCSGTGGPGTFGSYTMQILSNDIRIRGIDIANNACNYNHKIAGQSVALDIRGDRAAFFDVQLFGSQDTLYTGSLRTYFADIFINGTCDAIFGEGSAVFERAQIKMDFTVTAQKGNGSTAYLFLDSTINVLSEGPNTLYLGRPWGSLSKTVFSGCYLGQGVAKTAWNDWSHSCDSTQWCNSTFYAGYNNTGRGYSPSSWPLWTYILNETEGMQWTVEKVLGDWVPSSP